MCLLHLPTLLLQLDIRASSRMRNEVLRVAVIDATIHHARLVMGNKFRRVSCVQQALGRARRGKHAVFPVAMIS
jgi:hypothetical protein